MTIQPTFPGFGIEEQQAVQLAVVLEQIESVDRLRRVAKKARNHVCVRDCDVELASLRQIAEDYRKALAVPQSTACPAGKPQSEPEAAGGTETQDRQHGLEAAEMFTG